MERINFVLGCAASQLLLNLLQLIRSLTHGTSASQQFTFQNQAARMALTKLLWTQPDTPYDKPPPLHIGIIKSKKQERGLLWDFGETVKPITTKINKIGAITDCESVTTVTLFEEFESKFQEGFSYIFRGHDLRGDAPLKN